MEKLSLEFSDDGGDGRERRIGDEFYETIEAPKFVDLTAPDYYRPGDDRYWFCMRVGCDHKHEEEMDSEAIYKNFVLRVMAARSPNVRLRKALYRKDSRLKCPHTVPPKPSRPRVLISSTSKRLMDSKVKVKPLCKQNATPKAKAKDSSVKEKALTTPRNKKQQPNPDAFRSCRNLKATATAVPKNRVVAKALAFHSPKKTATTKTLLKDSTPIKSLCEGMKKLEITSGKKHVPPPDATRKQRRGREVKSKVFERLHTQNLKCQEPKSAKPLREKKREENLNMHDASKGGATLEELPAASESNFEEGSSGENNRTVSEDEKVIPVSRKGTDETTGSDFSHVTKIDDNKENASATDANRQQTSDVGRKFDGTQKELKKPNKEISGAQVLKLRRPKPTNPKPFRLRTDERGILKETTLEKQAVSQTATRPVPSSLLRENSHKNEKCLKQIVRNKTARCNAKEASKTQKEQAQNMISSSKKPNERVGRLTAPLRHTVSSKQKLVASQREPATKVGHPLKSTEPQIVRKIARIEGAQTSTKAAVADVPSSTTTSTHTTRQEKIRTIRKEPEFHILHVPKSCVNRVA